MVLQIKECTIGRICAPSSTNIFIKKLEKNIYLYFMISNTTFYRQFTDDTLLIWNDTKLESIKFVMDLIVPLAISC